jgi:hypothetical protein
VQEKRVGVLFYVSHFYITFNLEVGRKSVSLPGSTGQEEELGGLMHTPMLILSCPIHEGGHFHSF